MKEELKKSLTNLIDETLLELEELKKSRFSAEEIQIKGPGADNLAGKPVNGKIEGAEKAEDEEKDEEKKDEEAEKAEDACKAEDTKGVNVEKAEDKKPEDKKDEKPEEKKDEPHKDEPDHEKEEKDIAKKLLSMHKSVEELQSLKKSVEGVDALVKSIVEEKLAPVQAQLTSILDAVKKLADAPIPAKGTSYKDVAPLKKSDERAEMLSKSEVASKLWELKKSGTKVDSVDITKAETGHDLEKIIAKYDVK
jgi:hypothetical protein